MRKILLLSALALLNVNVAATDNSGFFSKHFLKEGLTHTESNILLNGGNIFNFITIMEYLWGTASLHFIPAFTVGYERKYSDESRLLFNITAGSALKFKRGNWKPEEYLKTFIIRSDFLWTFNIFQTEYSYIDYGFGLNGAVFLKNDSSEIKFTTFTGGIIPVYLSFNYQITDNVTGMVAVIPIPFVIPGIIVHEYGIEPFSLNDSFEIGFKIKM